MENMAKSLEALMLESVDLRRQSEDINDKLEEISEKLAALLSEETSDAADPPTAAAAAMSRNPNLPRFDEGDPIGWIARLEEYFGFYRINEAAKAGIALVALGGAASNWGDWIVRNFPNISWKELQYEVLRLYGDVSMDDTFEALLRTAQGYGGVAEYIDAFKARAVHVEDLSDFQAKVMFIHGLRGDIRARISSRGAADLSHAMRLALEAERHPFSNY